MEIPEEKTPITEVVANHPTVGEIVLRPQSKTESAVSTAIAKFKVEPETAVALREFFEPLERQASEWKEKAFQVVITDVSQTEMIKEAKTARLSVRQIRLNIENLHKEKKEDSLRKGQVLDLIKRTLVGMIEPIEKHLKEQEDFVELQESRRIQDLHKSRLAELEPYRVTGDNIEVLSLGEMSEVVFNGIKNGVISAHQQREQEKADHEKAAKEKEENDRKERERINAENERLKKANARINRLTALGMKYSEQPEETGRTLKGYSIHIGTGLLTISDFENMDDDVFDSEVAKLKIVIDEFNEREAKAKKYREERAERYTRRVQSLTTIGFVWSESGKSMEHAGIQYELSKGCLEDMADFEFDPLFDDISAMATKWANDQEAIRKKNEADAAELKENQEREALAERQRILEKKKLARAPDKTKLLALAEAIKNIEQPELKTEDGKEVLSNVKTLLDKVHKYINDQCANL